jgi:Sec7-like guanine-nucleotide exchange factor
MGRQNKQRQIVHSSKLDILKYMREKVNMFEGSFRYRRNNKNTTEKKNRNMDLSSSF